MKIRISKSFIIFFIILFIACGIRLMYLNSDFWYDEACSWAIANLDFPNGILDNLVNSDLQHTPLYFFLLHFWIKLFGMSEGAIQSLSLIFGIGLVPLSYVVAKKLTSNRNAIILMAFVATSPILVYFSVEARMYSMAAFWVLLSVNYLIDFEQKNNIQSLIKLTFANVLIPYTLVGGILYNISLAICYFIYLLRNKKDVVLNYFKSLIAEMFLLVPYFILIIHYFMMRKLFVIRHEGQILFFNVVDVIRNFFGTNIIKNIYWTSEQPYNLTLLFTILVIVPCIYFVYGIFQAGKNNQESFIKTFYNLFLLNFILFVVVSYFQISVFTGRYMLYLLAPLFILGVIGLSKNLSDKHLKIFSVLFVVCSLCFNLINVNHAKMLKTLAFKSVYNEAKSIALGADDVVIMPFGADAAYYFKTSDTPRVLNFDFHKEVRNPYNSKFYDENQMNLMSKNAKYGVVFDSVHSNRGFSDNHFRYFMNNVNAKVPKGRFVMIALYGEDAAALVSLEALRNSVKSLNDVKQNLLSIMLKKYLIDIIAYLNLDFDFVKSYAKDNYTYLIFQKR